ncbi:type VI secretion system accessory protein TagJ [Myxococcus faecalis]|uniref:type VI secretion system accessory protein TagJ n=1 Tax=Myxococcus faecalis TaxID=3115646 RepID=UPI003CF01026
MAQIEQHLAKGDFQAALQLIDAELSSAPSADRWLMAFNVRVRLEDFDGALRALDALVKLDPDVSDGVTFLGHCANLERLHSLRRKDPALAKERGALQAPQPFSRAYLQAAVSHAKGDFSDAARVLKDIASAAPKVPGTLTRTNGARVRFTDMIDSDDLTGPHLPCFQAGTVLDIPYNELASIQFERPRSSMDAVWVPAVFQTLTGQQFETRVPSRYPGSGLHGNAAVRLGEMTLWEHEPHGYAVGFGQRDFKLAHEDGGFGLVGLLQVTRIDFDAGGQRTAEEPRPKEKKSFWSKLFG